VACGGEGRWELTECARTFLARADEVYELWRWVKVVRESGQLIRGNGWVNEAALFCDAFEFITREERKYRSR
jgi:hypothetical protein